MIDKAFLKGIPKLPGIYQMSDGRGRILYVGKAKNLKDRLTSYFNKNQLSTKTAYLMKQVEQIDITLTENEKEALILECNLIKTLKPRYNVLLRDDKSYPYIVISKDPFPQLYYYRGKQSPKGKVFGPYPNGLAVKETINLLQKLFQIRQCNNVFFKNRTRPCLQYQIKRCTAPCVGYVDEENYHKQVRHAELFLQGQSKELIKELSQRMKQASSELAYEKAATYRDQVKHLKTIQEKQHVAKQDGDIDIVAIVNEQDLTCIQVIYVRGGRLIGNKSLFPTVPKEKAEDEILSSFTAQYYLNKHHSRDIPDRILVNFIPNERELLEEVLTEQRGKKVTIQVPQRGTGKQWIKMADNNARQSIRLRLATQSSNELRYEALRGSLKLTETPNHIECFDISHTQGENAVASCVVFGPEGTIKSLYRQYIIEDITPGDDYAAMKQALTRRYSKIKETNGLMPDVIMIDGGKGQLNQAIAVVEELQLLGVTLISISKGLGRKVGLEKISVANFSTGEAVPLSIDSDEPAFHLLTFIRDEAHRFAITKHRARRQKQSGQSTLDEIEGVGPIIKRRLLESFKDVKKIANSTIEELTGIKEINHDLAKKIIAHLKNNGVF